jgi:hypothetical protein
VTATRGVALRPPDLPKVYRELAAEAIAVGFTITRTRADHLAWRAPDGSTTIHTALTPSDWRGIKNDRARLERAGLPKRVKQKSQLPRDQRKRETRARADLRKRGRSR